VEKEEYCTSKNNIKRIYTECVEMYLVIKNACPIFLDLDYKKQKMKQIILWISIAIFLSNCSLKKEVGKQPNFIIIYTDDQRFDGIGFNNNKIIQTPNIDKIASRALNFTNANVAFSLCSPSRAALLTGRYGSHNGVLNLGSGFNEGEVTLAKYLKEEGYATGLSGKWHIKQDPKSVGFDFYSYFKGNGSYYERTVINLQDTVKPKIHVDKYGVQKSIEFLERHAKTETPFFLFHCPQTPHMNGNLVWDASDSTKQKYAVMDMPVPENRLDDLNTKPSYLKKVRNLLQGKKYGYPDSLAIQNHTLDYYSVITELDGFLGELFRKIETLGLIENTYVIFMSDNGWMLGDHGFTSKVLPFKPSTHVPFWILGPGTNAGFNSSLVSNLDLTPTILEIAEVAIPDNIHGTSLYSILKGEENKVRDYFIYEGLGSFGGSLPNLCVITEKYRYVVTYSDSSLRQVKYKELYNQKKDPSEMNNLADESKYKEIVRIMDKRVDDFKNKQLPKQ